MNNENCFQTISTFEIVSVTGFSMQPAYMKWIAPYPSDAKESFQQRNMQPAMVTVLTSPYIVAHEIFGLMFSNLVYSNVSIQKFPIFKEQLYS